MASATSSAVFGNLEELHDFHAGVLYPELDRCGANPAAVARAFVENCPELRALYSDQCRNMHSAHRYALRVTATSDSHPSPNCTSLGAISRESAKPMESS